MPVRATAFTESIAYRRVRRFAFGGDGSGRARRRQRQHRVDRLGVARGAQLFRHVLVAQQPRDSRQRFQVIGAGAFGRQQQEDQVDRLAVHRLEIDRPLQPREQAEQLFQLGQLPM